MASGYHYIGWPAVDPDSGPDSRRYRTPLIRSRHNAATGPPPRGMHPHTLPPPMLNRAFPTGSSSPFFQHFFIWALFWDSSLSTDLSRHLLPSEIKAKKKERFFVMEISHQLSSKPSTVESDFPSLATCCPRAAGHVATAKALTFFYARESERLVTLTFSIKNLTHAGRWFRF